MSAPDRIRLEFDRFGSLSNIWSPTGPEGDEFVRLTPELAALIEAAAIYDATISAGRAQGDARNALGTAAIKHARTQEPTP